MNKIKQAFSTIKVDNRLKEKTYLAIKERSNKRTFPFKPVIIVNTVLALTLIVVFNYEPNNNNPDRDKAMDMGINVFTESATNSFNSFVYNGNNYIISDMIITTSDLDTNLGVLKDVIDNAMDGYQECELYTIKNNTNILVIKDGSNLYSYQKQ